MHIEKNKVLAHVNSNVAKMLHEEEYNVEMRSAKNYLHPDRIDIFIKYLYAKIRLNGKKGELLERLYVEHIRSFNQFVEADSTGKVGKEAFVSNFNSVIDSVKENGFDKDKIIPIDKCGRPIDGAHRIATASALELLIPTFQISDYISSVFNYEFFKERGMSEELLDYTAVRYAEEQPNTFMVMVWPAAKGHDDEIKEILGRYGKIVNEKTVRLSYNGMANLQRIVYKREPWVGSYSNEFEGVHTKSSQCYNEDGVLRAFLFESTADLIQMKDEIRDLFRIGKHAVHINDTKEETIEISRLVFNKNSINFLNCASRKEMKTFNKLFSQFKRYVEEKHIDKNEIAIIGGVLPLFGIRDASDLDYISNVEMPEKISDEIELETKKIKYTKLSTNEIISNPDYHFIYDGIKFASLEVILEIKETRNNDSDKRDASYIRKLLKDGEIKYTLKERLQILTSVSFYRRNIKIFLLKVRFYLYLLLGKGKHGKS